jgi:hypothetical protein
METAVQYIPDFVVKPRQYTLHNSSPEPVDCLWSGILFTVPPVDAVGPLPAKYEDGTPIPGTIVIRDTYCFGGDGEVPAGGPFNWLAAEAIRNVLQIDPTTGEAIGPHARKGISFLPDNPTREQVRLTREKGEARYQEFMVEWANYTVNAYEQAREKSKQAGYLPRPPGPDYHKAMAIMNKFNERVQKGLAPEMKMIQEASDDDELEFIAFAKVKAMELAEKAALNKDVDKLKLAEDLLEDPTVKAQLRRKYSIRKRGYLPEEAAPAE